MHNSQIMHRNVKIKVTGRDAGGGGRGHQRDENHDTCMCINCELIGW